MAKKKTHAQYLNELLEGEIDFIPLEDYKGANIKIEHECFEGHRILKSPSAILRGHGCAECNGNKLKTLEQYNKELEGRKIICLGPYINNAYPTMHECLKCNTQWKAQPGVVKIKTGCPSCAAKGFDRTKSAILYVIKIGVFYKVGITNRTVQSRYAQDKDKKIEIIFQKSFDTGYKAEKLEKYLLKRYKHLRISYPGYLNSGGNTELFKELPNGKLL